MERLHDSPSTEGRSINAGGDVPRKASEMSEEDEEFHRNIGTQNIRATLNPIRPSVAQRIQKHHKRKVICVIVLVVAVVLAAVTAAMTAVFLKQEIQEEISSFQSSEATIVQEAVRAARGAPCHPAPGKDDNCGTPARVHKSSDPPDDTARKAPRKPAYTGPPLDAKCNKNEDCDTVSSRDSANDGDKVKGQDRTEKLPAQVEKEIQGEKFEVDHPSQKGKKMKLIKYDVPGLDKPLALWGDELVGEFDCPANNVRGCVYRPEGRVKGQDNSRRRLASVAMAGTSSWKWPKVGSFYEVPYIIHSTLYSSDRTYVDWAIGEMNKHTAVRLVPRTSQMYFVKFIAGSGCSSFVGRVTSSTYANIGQPITLGNCGRSALHEVLHAIGFYHEQTSPIRDNHVYINFANIQSHATNNFEKKSTYQAQQIGSYDYGSIMHYSKTAFAINYGTNTITPKPDSYTSIGQRNGFSATDILGVRTVYPGYVPTPFPTNKPTPQPTPFPTVSGPVPISNTPQWPAHKVMANSYCANGFQFIGYYATALHCSQAVKDRDAPYFFYGKPGTERDHQCFLYHSIGPDCPETGYQSYQHFDSYGVGYGEGKMFYRVKDDANCGSTDPFLGYVASGPTAADECAALCMANEGCRFFMVGKGSRLGSCWMMGSDTQDCTEGYFTWEADIFAIGTQCNPSRVNGLTCLNKAGSNVSASVSAVDWDFCGPTENRAYCPEGLYMCNDNRCRTQNDCATGLKLTKSQCPDYSCNPNKCNGLVCYSSETCGVSGDWNHCATTEAREACPVGLLMTAMGRCGNLALAATQNGVVIGSNACPERPTRVQPCNANPCVTGLYCYSQPGICGKPGDWGFCFSRADRRYCPRGTVMCGDGLCVLTEADCAARNSPHVQALAVCPWV